LAARIESARIARNPFNVRYDAAPPWPRPDMHFSIACVGRLQPMAKGQDLLLSVMRLEKWRERPIRLTLYGTGPNEATLRRLKATWQLDNVEFGGFCSDVEALWGRHHALVVTSRYEGLPLVIVEAMLCARACIVTNVAGNAELIEDNVSGFVAAGATVRALDEGLERAWQRRDEWQAVGQCAAQQVRRLVPEDPPAVLAKELERLLT
jgi:glycosyltransferase involved in cell wall biosynthesis